MDVTRDDLDDLHRELGEIQMEIGRATTSLSAVMMHAASMTSRLHELQQSVALPQSVQDLPALPKRQPVAVATPVPPMPTSRLGLEQRVREVLPRLVAKGRRTNNNEIAALTESNVLDVLKVMRRIADEGVVQCIPGVNKGKMRWVLPDFAPDEALPVPSAPTPDPIREETIARLKAVVAPSLDPEHPPASTVMRGMVRDAFGALTMARGAAWTLDNMEAVLGVRSVNAIPVDDLPAALERIKAEMEPKPAGATEQPTFEQVDTARQQAEGLARSVGLPEAVAQEIGVSAMIDALSPSPAPEPSHEDLEPSRDDDEALLAAMEAEMEAESEPEPAPAPPPIIRDIPETRVVPRYIEDHLVSRMVGAARSPELPKAQPETPRVQVGTVQLPSDIDFAGKCLAFRGLDVFGPQGGASFTRPAVAVLKRMADGGLYPLNRLINHGDWLGAELLRSHLRAIKPTLRAMGVELVEVGREDFRIRALETVGA